MSAIGKAPAAAAAATASSSEAPANAWAQPLRTKGNVAGPPPGMGKGSKNSPNNGNNGASSGGSGSSGVQNALRERFIGLSLNMVGQKVVVTQTNGTVFEGVFHTFSPFANLPAAKKNKYVIKACKVIKAPQSTDNNQPQVVDQSTVIIAADKVACLTVKSMRIDTLSPSSSNGNSQQKAGDAFRTDTEISGAQGGQQRDLVAAGSAWTPSESDGSSGGGGNSRAEALMGALGDKDTKGSRRKPFNNPNSTAGLGKGNIGEWDQFQANQELFNVKATFDENLYTTELDKSQIDNKKIAAAERLAREIENTTSNNTHIAEERGHKLEGDFDEEDRYSGVLKGKKAAKITIARSDINEEANDQKSASSSQAPKKMNYAAAAAKADPTKKNGPPGFDPSKEAKTADSPDSPDVETEQESVKESPGAEKQQKGKEAKAKEEKPAEKLVDGKGEKDKAKAGKTSEKPSKAAPAADAPMKPAEKPDNGVATKSALKLSTKLNANAKEFTLNPTARTFTPGAPSAPSTGGQFVDPNAAMHAAQIAAGHMPGHHYMHGAPMGQPGMMPMMAPQFPGGVRYQAAYAGMEHQHMQQMPPHQPQHLYASAHGSGAPSPAPGVAEDDTSQAQQDNAEGGAASQSQQQPSQQQQQQQQVPPVPYGAVPPPYYAGGMGMHQRGPSGPHPGYHPQFVGGPQQIPVGPGGGPYRHMYPMQPGGMAPNAQVRGPGGAPYYGGPGAPVPYSPGAYVGLNMMEDESNFRGGGGGRNSGRGRGGGRTGRGGRRGGGRGGGGRNFNNSYHQQHGGRHGGQNNQSHNPQQENPSASEGGNAQPDKGASGPNQTPKSEESTQ